jgi:hypothetical protein
MMTYWIDTTTDTPVTEADIRSAHPLTVFPVNPFRPQPERYTAVPVLEMPEHDPATHHAELKAPALVGGTWQQDWDVVAYTTGELDAMRRARVPASVTRRQARQALLLAGLLDQVPTAIASIPDATQRALAQIEWEDSQTFERSRPLLIQLADALGLNEQALDDLFIQASKL